MTCQQPGCSFDIFSSCINHCTQNVCLKHLIEHGDLFLSDYTELLDHLNKSASILMQEANIAATQIKERRQCEIERINRLYDEEQQEIRQRLTLAETAHALVNDKQRQLTNSKQQNESYISQHDFEQIKIYTNQINKYSLEQQVKVEKPTTTNLEILDDSSDIIKNDPNVTYACPLTGPNVFGIKPEHNLRFECDGPAFRKYSLTKHLEYYHRMLPDCAMRLRNAIVNGQSGSETKLFSDDEIILNEDYFIDCPLTDPKNVFGARSSLSTLMHIPCTKKQLTAPAILNHFQLYHKMKCDAAKKLFAAIRTKSITADLILFNKDERIGTNIRKK